MESSTALKPRPPVIDVKRLRIRLAELNWNASDLARKINVSPKTTSAILRRDRSGRPLIQKIAKAVKLPVEELLETPHEVTE
jgi:transcriptional regulator with XRE-family HTH domain